jgi:hypothetical protein
MTESKPLRNATDLFQRINRLSSEAEWSESELLEALLQEGIDPTLFLESVRTNVKKLLRESPYYWRNRAAALRSKLKSTMFAAQRRQTQKLSRKEILDNIKTTLARLPPDLTQEFSFEHRNFEVCSDEDLESILLELDCIENLDAPNANE